MGRNGSDPPDGQNGSAPFLVGLTYQEKKTQIMKDAKDFLRSLETSARMMAPSARATFEANEELSSWLLNPLAQWADAAYGDRAFQDAAKGYAKYCMGVWKSQQLYEKT